MISERTVRIIILALAGAALLALIFGVNSCRSRNAARVETKLATGQADASLKSGADAVNTIGNRMSADAESDTITRENTDAIHNAEGADAPVAAGVRDAGLASLCRRAAYRRDPKCMQHARP